MDYTKLTIPNVLYQMAYTKWTIPNELYQMDDYTKLKDYTK